MLPVALDDIEQIAGDAILRRPVKVQKIFPLPRHQLVEDERAPRTVVDRKFLAFAVDGNKARMGDCRRYDARDQRPSGERPHLELAQPSSESEYKRVNNVDVDEATLAAFAST